MQRSRSREHDPMLWVAIIGSAVFWLFLIYEAGRELRLW
jgi:hypothetical protein